MLTLHDVVAICHESKDERQNHDSDLPERHVLGSRRKATSAPSSVHTSPDANRVADIVGTVSEGRGAGGDNLHERVQVLDLVGVLGRVGVGALHPLALRRTLNTNLRCVDIVVSTVQKSDDDDSRDALDKVDQVANLVNGAGTHRVGMQVAHRPAQRVLLGAELGVVLLESLAHEDGVVFLVDLALDGGLLAGSFGVDIVDILADTLGSRRRRLLDLRLVVLDDGKVGHLRLRRALGSRATPQKGSLDDLPPLEGMVLLDNLGVNEGQEEDGAEDAQAHTDADGHRRDVPSRLGAESQTRRALVDDGKRADGSGDEEEEG
jgi:hypothetical protein